MRSLASKAAPNRNTYKWILLARRIHSMCAARLAVKGLRKVMIIINKLTLQSAFPATPICSSSMSGIWVSVTIAGIGLGCSGKEQYVYTVGVCVCAYVCVMRSLQHSLVFCHRSSYMYMWTTSCHWQFHTVQVADLVLIVVQKCTDEWIFSCVFGLPAVVF